MGAMDSKGTLLCRILYGLSQIEFIQKLRFKNYSEEDEKAGKKEFSHRPRKDFSVVWVHTIL